jgi:hypothetical protein
MSRVTSESLSLAFAVSVIDLAMYGLVYSGDAMLAGNFGLGEATKVGGTEVIARLYFLQLPVQIVLLSLSYRWLRRAFMPVSVLVACVSSFFIFAVVTGFGPSNYARFFLLECTIFGCHVSPGLAVLTSSGTAAGLVWLIARPYDSPNSGLHGGAPHGG